MTENSGKECKDIWHEKRCCPTCKIHIGDHILKVGLKEGYTQALKDVVQEYDKSETKEDFEDWVTLRFKEVLKAGDKK